MKIKEIISQNRRDFTAIYQCEHCGHERPFKIMQNQIQL